MGSPDQSDAVDELIWYLAGLVLTRVRVVRASIELHIDRYACIRTFTWGTDEVGAEEEQFVSTSQPPQHLYRFHFLILPIARAPTQKAGFECVVSSGPGADLFAFVRPSRHNVITLDLIA
jgi:hypothetical protein